MQFIGESKNGNIQEALAAAIEKAKEQLQTDFIDWKLKTIDGSDGGFITISNLRIAIDAKPH